MSGIEKKSLIEREALSGERYFQSLLEQGYRAKLLSEAELEQIQLDCLALLAKKTEAFNGECSSSIRIEKAQDILASLLFTIGVQLKTYQSPEDAIAALQRDGVESVFAGGRRRIDRLVAQAKMRHASLARSLLQTGNIFYSATVIDGINGFFRLYSPDFAAQEVHITADYPVYNKTGSLLGVEFIGRYLEQLYLENRFLMRFMADDIHHLLCGYDKHYERLLFNLYEPVLAAALGCVLANTRVERLEITPAVLSSLSRLFSGKGCAEIERLLGRALSKLEKSLSFSDSLRAYVKQSLPPLAATIASAAEAGRLAQIFIVKSYPENNPRLTVAYGERMENRAYRGVLQEFMNSGSTAEQITIMKNQISSLADLNDLLLDSELCAEEIAVFLKELRPAEIAALMKKYTNEYEMSFTELRDCEKTLCEGLRLFAASLPLEQKRLLEKAVKLLEVN